jgi:phosphoribosyl 1,2-cyclic phosphodiesterase
MSLYITSLNSGSNGNCYYIGNNTEAVLVDAGLSCKEIEKRMQLLGLSMDIVKAIFISHEHTDHIKGVTTLANKYSLKVYITDETAKRGPRLIKHLSESFTAHEPVTIGNLSITAFPKFHDAADPHSFIITGSKITIGVFTDIGNPCVQLAKYLNLCHAAFLEANYDEEMLENGHYPYVLKKRIRGGEGHLSNAQALEVFVKHRPSFMTHLLLSHLSKDNNSPELVKDLFTKNASGVNIIVASRYEATPVYKIESPISIKLKQPVSLLPKQMQLF